MTTFRLLVSLWIVALTGMLLPLEAHAGSLEAAAEEVLVAQSPGILKVTPNVKGARVLLNGVEAGMTPLVKLVTPGKYTVRIEASGYEPYEEEVTVLVNKSITVQPQLVKVVGSLEITTNVEDAEVFVQGQFRGRTPNLVLDDLPQGTYQIQVKKSGFAPYTGPVTVKPNVRLRLKVELVANAGILVVTSSPPEANVFLDDQFIGKCPQTLQSVSAGRHSLRVELADYGTFYRGFQIGVGERIEIQARLAAESGGLRVKSGEPGASVYLEGSFVGKTPLELEDRIQPGEYSLRISLDEYADYLQPVVIESNRTTKVSAELIALTDAMRPGSSSGGRDNDDGLLTKWWFWTTVGGVVAATAGGTTAVLLDREAAAVGDIVMSLP